MGRWKKEKVTYNTRKMREWLQTDVGIEYQKGRSEYLKEWRSKNKDKRIAIQKRSYEKIKAECFAHYGGAVCKCCGETETKFLHLDHINGDGALLRKEWVKTTKKVMGGTGYYYWLKKNNYPEDLKLQVLCANCNLGKRTNKYCPHELNRGTDMNGDAIPAEELPIPYPEVTRRLRGEAQKEAQELGVNVATLRMRKWRERKKELKNYEN